MTVTAHGWTPDPLDDRDAFGPEGGGLTHRDFSPEEARSLVRCIEDAATLAKVRDLVTEWTEGDQRYPDLVVTDIAALLSGDGTP